MMSQKSLLDNYLYLFIFIDNTYCSIVLESEFGVVVKVTYVGLAVKRRVWRPPLDGKLKFFKHSFVFVHL